MINFKCRCTSQFNQRMASMPYMSGTWKVHHSLISLVKPPGLHRVYYQLKDNNPDNMCADNGWIEIKYRNSERVPRLDDKNFFYA